jgi:3-oxoacyl-(acyl-carrier-protein) synthase
MRGASGVVVSGLGFITSIGNCRSEVIASLCELRHGFANCDLEPGIELPVKVIGPVRHFDVSSANSNAWVWPPEYDYERQFIRGLPPHGVYAACALVQALREAGLSTDDLVDGQTGMYCASGGSPMLVRHHLNRMAETQRSISI